MPTPGKKETQDEFVSRCIPVVLEEGTAEDQEQAAAICFSMWRDHLKEIGPLRDYILGEFRGNFPQVAVSATVNIDALTKGDEDPFFVTLPVARVGETSVNGLYYDEELVGAIVDQVVGRGGTMGHLKDEERGTAFPVEDVDWVGVLRQGDMAWGKAYIPPGEVREYVRRLMARGGKLATSIYGPYTEREALQGGGWRVRGFRLEQLDLAPADRAALSLGGQFAVTSQMMHTETNVEEVEMSKDEILAELTVKEVPQTLREQIIQEWQAKNDTQARIAELEQERDAEKANAAKLQAQVDAAAALAFEAKLDARIAEIIDWDVKGEDAQAKVKTLRAQLKSRIVAEMGDGHDEQRLNEVATTVWDELKPLAEMIRDALAGPAALIRSKVRSTHKIEDSPETRRNARARVGL